MRRFLALLVILSIIASIIFTVPAQASLDYSMIRVALSSMGTPSKVELYKNGDFTIAGNSSVNIKAATNYTITVSSGKLKLEGGGTTYTLSSPFTFKNKSGSLRVKNPAYGTKYYPGDMEVRIVDGGIRLTNHVDMETYLYGVLPFEMSNSWPLEALKAQAVAARTYAARARRSSNYFDLYDTQSSQVYQGYDPAYARCIQAVDETKGLVLMYNNSFVGTYYSSSNGGMTEATKNIFVQDLPYSVVKEDPYDIRNKSNSRATWTITYTKKPVSSSLANRLIQRMKSSVDSKGYSSNDPNIKVLELKEIFFEPQNESGRIDKGYLLAKLLVKKKQLAGSHDWVKIRYNGQDAYMAVQYLAFNEPASDGTMTGTVTEARVNVRKGPGTNYDSIGIVKKDSKLTIVDSNMQIIEQKLSFNKNTARGVLNLPSLLVTVEDKGDSFVLNGGGFGHGVGMSQYGAQQMAREDYTFDQILDFYYPGTQLTLMYGGSDDLPDRGDGDRPDPSQEPSPEPTQEPSPEPTKEPTPEPTVKPTAKPTAQPTAKPTQAPTAKPTQAPTAKPTAKPTNPPKDQTVKSGTVKVPTALNMRTGPGTNYPIIIQLKNNTKLEILGESGKWYKVKVNNYTGYVHKDYVETSGSSGTTKPPVEPEKPAPVDPAPPPDKEKYGYVTCSRLNVRSGPSTKNHSVGVVEKGSKLKVLGKTGNWYEVEYKGVKRYVSADYLNVQESTGTSQQTIGTVNASALNVRTGPGTSYKAVGYVTKGTKLTILGKSGSWYKINYKGATRYVSTSYVTVSGQSSGNTSTSRTGTVTASALNVRTGPGTSYKAVGYVTKGTKLTILCKSGSWYKINYKGATRYVSTSYVIVSGQSSGNTSTSRTGTVTASALNVRSGPGTNYKIVSRLVRNNKVTITGTSGKWYKIRLNNTTAYVHSDYIK